MDIEAAETKQWIKIHSHFAVRWGICKRAWAFIKDCQDRFELICIKEVAHITRLFKQSVHLSTQQCAVAWGTFVERNLLDLHTTCICDKAHRDTLH